MTNETPETTPEIRPGRPKPGEEEGWVTQEVASAALGLTPRRIQQLITPVPEQGGGEPTPDMPLWGRKVKPKPGSRTRKWELDRASVMRERDRRAAGGRLEEAVASGEIPAGGYDATDIVDATARAYVQIARDLAGAHEAAADARARLQLTERAESTMRAELEEERRRREEAERDLDATRRERDRLREELQEARAGGPKEARARGGLLARLFGR